MTNSKDQSFSTVYPVPPGLVSDDDLVLGLLSTLEEFSFPTRVLLVFWDSKILSSTKVVSYTDSDFYRGFVDGSEGIHRSIVFLAIGWYTYT